MQRSEALRERRSDARWSRGRLTAANVPALCDSWQLCQGSGQGQHVARVGGFERYPAEQPFQIEDAIERAAQFFAADGFFYLDLDCVQAGVDLRSCRSTGAVARSAAGVCPWA